MNIWFKEDALKVQNFCGKQKVNGRDILWIQKLLMTQRQKKNIVVNTVVTEDTVNPTEQLIGHFSSWKRLRVAVGWILKLKKILISLNQKRKQLCSVCIDDCNRLAGINLEMEKLKATFSDQKLSADDLFEAETAIIRFSQEQTFPLKKLFLIYHRSHMLVLIILDPLV